MDRYNTAMEQQRLAMTGGAKEKTRKDKTGEGMAWIGKAKEWRRRE